jgi:hypothetical protein
MSLSFNNEAVQSGLRLSGLDPTTGLYRYQFSIRSSVYNYITVFGKTIYSNPNIRLAAADAVLLSTVEDDGYDTISITHSLSILINKNEPEIKAHLRFIMEDTDVDEYRLDFNPKTTVFTFKEKLTNGRPVPLHSHDLKLEIIEKSYLTPYLLEK